MSDPPPQPETPAQRVDRLEARLTSLRNRLAALEIDLTVERARLSNFTGEAAAKWGEFQVNTAAAWDAYMLADERCSEAKAAVAPDGTAPGENGPTGGETAASRRARELLDDAEAELDETDPGVTAAEEIVAALRHRWNIQELRIMDARGAARSVGAGEAVSYADLLLELVSRDPLALSEDDVTTLETQAETARTRRVQAERKAGHLEVELGKARLLEDLKQTVTETRDCLTYARSRIVGLPDEDPVSSDDLNDLYDRFREICDKAEQTPDTPSVALAEELADELELWRSHYDSIRARWDTALTESCNAVQRRDQFRGTWKALRAKASACRLDEDPDVRKLLSAVRQLLWTAPLDLDVAAPTLARLAGIIHERFLRVEERR
jgi:hypothetical protein